MSHGDWLGCELYELGEMVVKARFLPCYQPHALLLLHLITGHVSVLEPALFVLNKRGEG